MDVAQPLYDQTGVCRRSFWIRCIVFWELTLNDFNADIVWWMIEEEKNTVESSLAKFLEQFYCCWT